MMTEKKPLAMITGASSGIGVELARVFAKEGFDLLLVARRQAELEILADELEDAHGIQCKVLPCDLTAPGAIEELMAAMPRRPLDVLVNNAGVMQIGNFASDKLDRQLQQIHLNILALTELTYRCLGPMLNRGKGRILNLASVAAFQPVPFLSVYAATKAYVLSFTEGLSEEIKGSGVSCTAVCPGFTDTPMLRGKKNLDKKPANLPMAIVSDPAFVAREAFSAAMSREVVVVPGMMYKALSTLSRVSPNFLIRSITGTFARKNSKKK